MIQAQFGISIKHLGSDNCKEYVNKTLSRSFEEIGLVQEFTCVDTPQKNGDVERTN